MDFWQRRNFIILPTLGKIDSLRNVSFNLGEIHWSTLADNRLHPEGMAEPTEENPVPGVKDMSVVALKNVYVGTGMLRSM